MSELCRCLWYFLFAAAHILQKILPYMQDGSILKVSSFCATVQRGGLLVSLVLAKKCKSPEQTCFGACLAFTMTAQSTMALVSF